MTAYGIHSQRVLCQTPSVCEARARLAPSTAGEAARAVLEGVRPALAGGMYIQQLEGASNVYSNMS